MVTTIPAFCVFYCALVNDSASKIFSLGILVAGVSLPPTYTGKFNLKAYPLQ